jgi:signal-transduction protein with cAMP-binding, CBS, and nucleotidyltransferase domain
VAGFDAHLASLPTRSCAEGEVVLTAGSTTGQLLFLKDGVVEVVKDGVRIARVAEPGAVLGEMSALLGQPHTAEVTATAPSTFYVVRCRGVLLEKRSRVVDHIRGDRHDRPQASAQGRPAAPPRRLVATPVSRD